MITRHTVKAHEAHRRLDSFAASFWPHISRTDWTKIIRKQQLLVNGSPEKPSSVLKTGDAIEWKNPFEEKQKKLLAEPNLPVSDIFHNQHFLIIDKPAAIAMHPTSAEGTGTIANWLLAKYPDIASVGEDGLRPGIVHRLDKNTSGLCIIARTKEAFEALKTLFQKRLIRKTYVAIVHGHLPEQSGTIDAPIARSMSLRKQTTVKHPIQSRGKIRNARTKYSVIESFGSFDTVEVLPETGRMHQIRVHLASIGHPLVGDALYGTKITRIKEQALTLPLQRHLLHATRLKFSLFGENYDFSSPLPEDFESFRAKNASVLTKKG